MSKEIKQSICIYLPFAIENSRSSTYKYYETLRCFFSRQSGFFMFDKLKEFCDSYELKLDTYQRHIKKAVKKGWIHQDGDLYHIPAALHHTYKDYHKSITEGPLNSYERKIRQESIVVDLDTLLNTSKKSFARLLMNTVVDDIHGIKESKEKYFQAKQSSINKNGHYSKKVFNYEDASWEKVLYSQEDLTIARRKISNTLVINTARLKMAGSIHTSENKRKKSTRTVASNFALNCSRIIGFNFTGEIFSVVENSDTIEVIASQAIKANQIRWSKSDKDQFSVSLSATLPLDSDGEIIAERLVKTIIKRTKVSNKVLAKKMGRSTTTLHTYIKEQEALGELSVLRTLWVMGEYSPDLVMALNSLDQAEYPDGMQFRAMRLKASSVKAMRFCKERNCYVKYDNLFSDNRSYKDSKYLTVLVLTNQYATTSVGKISTGDLANLTKITNNALKD